MSFYITEFVGRQTLTPVLIAPSYTLEAAKNVALKGAINGKLSDWQPDLPVLQEWHRRSRDLGSPPPVEALKASTNYGVTFYVVKWEGAAA